MVAVPEAVAFYWADELNRAAIDALLADGGTPADLSLDELSALEAARLAAHRVKVELWQFLHCVGRETIGEAVRTAFPHARAMTVAELTTQGYPPTVETTWGDRTLYLGWALNAGTGLIGWVGLANRDRELLLGMSVAQGDDWTIGEGLALEPAWSLDDEGWWVPVDGAVSLDDRLEEAICARKLLCITAVERVSAADLTWGAR